jgi:hypothetical protein
VIIQNQCPTDKNPKTMVNFGNLAEREKYKESAISQTFVEEIDQ